MRTRTFVIVAVAAVVLTAWVIGARRTEGSPYGPDSTDPAGTKAVVELVNRHAAMTVLDGVPDGTIDTALLLVDRFDRDRARELDQWVRAGGTLVVADPNSPETPAVGGATSGAVAVGCAAPLDLVRELDLGDGRTFATDSSLGCRGGTGAVVLVESVGDGNRVAVSSRDLFTNGLLGEADNAVLAVSLLAPTSDTRSAFLAPRAIVGSGDASLVDLVGPPAWAAMAQLLVAFGAVVLWRSRRLGSPVTESELVAIESAELTSAFGRLMEQNRRPERAAAALRDRARRDLSGPLGLPLDATVDLVVDTLTARTSLTASEARTAVATPVVTDDDLVVVANLLVRIREEITHDITRSRP